MAIEILLKIYLVLVATLFGSFANVLIHRLPREQSVIFPRSRCPHCASLIRWYQNIPLLSYLVLRGRCAACTQRISPRYFINELLTALFAFWQLPFLVTWESGLLYGVRVLIFILFLAICYIDWDYKIIPDEINIALALLFPLLAYLESHAGIHLIWGGLIGFFFPYLITWGFYKFRGKIGLGGGDIKLYTALGLYLGPLGIIHNIFLSCLLGSVVGLLLILCKKMDRATYIPFGPYIVVVAFVQLFSPYLLTFFLPTL